MLGRAVAASMHRGGMHTLFSGVAKIFTLSEYSLINLECPLTDELNPAQKEFVFHAPCSVALALKEGGITMANLANNHTLDHQQKGFINTLSALNAAPIIPVGISDKPSHIQLNTTRVAVFGAHLVGAQCTLERESLIYQPSDSQLIQTITAYHKNFPADIILLTLHWGFEYREFPTSAQRALAYKLLEAGVSVIAGHHPHVLQPLEFYKGGVIFYSLGNLVFDQSSPVTRRSLIVSLGIRSGTIHSLTLYPLVLEASVPRRCTRAQWGAFEIIGENKSITLRFANSDP